MPGLSQSIGLGKSLSLPSAIGSPKQGGGVVPPVPQFDPISLSKLSAMYSALDADTVTASQWMDRSANARHGTKVGTVAFEPANAVANGYPAQVWPDAQATANGFDLPGMTIQEVIFVVAYRDGVDSLFDFASTLIAGLSGASGNPRLVGTVNSTRWQGGAPANTMAESAFVEGGQVQAGQQTAVLDALPSGFKAFNFRPSVAYTETGWRLGYNPDVASRCWSGPMVMVLLFSEILTDKERGQVYGYINRRLNKKLPVPSWSMAKTGQIIAPLSNAPEAPPYYPHPVDVRSIAAIPCDFLIFSSPDHQTVSGIYLHLAWGDPAAPTTIKSYDQALSEGLLSGIPNKPAANPIFNYTASGESTETPCVNIVDGTFVLTFQQGKFGRQQTTCRAICPADGSSLNFSFSGPILEYTIESGPGNGATSYFRWDVNPFPDLINPATGLKYLFCGYSLHGDTAKGFFAQWATDDPVFGVWTRTAILQKVTGRATNSSRFVSMITVDLKGAHAVPGGVSLLGSYKTPGAAGGTGGSSELVEMILDTKGQQLIGMPITVLKTGGSGAFDSAEIDTTTSVEYNGKRSIIYNATNASNYNSAGGAIGDLDLTSVASFAPLLPAIPANPTVYDVDFRQNVGLPAWLSLVSLGTTPPTIVPTSSGLEIRGSTGAIDGEAGLLFSPSTFDMQTTNFVEMDIWGWSTISADKSRVPLYGLVTPATGGMDAITDGVYFNNGPVLGGDFWRKQKAANVEVVSAVSTVYQGFGIEATNDAEGWARSPKRLGLRFFPKDGRFYITGESQGEFETFTLHSSVNKALAYALYLGLKFKGTNVVERIERITIRHG